MSTNVWFLPRHLPILKQNQCHPKTVSESLQFCSSYYYISPKSQFPVNVSLKAAYRDVLKSTTYTRLPVDDHLQLNKIFNT